MFTKIAECKHCGRKSTDSNSKQGRLTGYKGVCLVCGAENDDWLLACNCGNEAVYLQEEDTRIADTCDNCGAAADDFRSVGIHPSIASEVMFGEIVSIPRNEWGRWVPSWVVRVKARQSSD